MVRQFLPSPARPQVPKEHLYMVTNASRTLLLLQETKVTSTDRTETLLWVHRIGCGTKQHGGHAKKGHL
jgi:hypothetical protein